MSSIQLTRGASDKFLSPAEQQAKIDDVRKLIGPVPFLCSEASILRFLKARNWNTKKASKMKILLKKPQQMKEDDIKRFDSPGACCSSPSFHPSSSLSESQQESTDLDHGSKASDEGRLSHIEEPTAPNSKCIDDNTTKAVSLNCKDIQVADAAVAKQVQ